MFERAHHQRIARVLGAVDADAFADAHVSFGGGTAIALRCGEYRESVDVDFLVADVAGYGAVRAKATAAGGVQNLARAGQCMAAMAMTTTTPALLLKRIKRLVP